VITAVRLASLRVNIYRPDPAGRLQPVGDLGFGPDVFDRPAAPAG
jgi:hypothetical protein